MRLRWLGHVIRIEKVISDDYNGRAEGTRSRGRPVLRTLEKWKWYSGTLAGTRSRSRPELRILGIFK